MRRGRNNRTMIRILREAHVIRLSRAQRDAPLGNPMAGDRKPSPNVPWLSRSTTEKADELIDYGTAQELVHCTCR